MRSKFSEKGIFFFLQNHYAKLYEKTALHLLSKNLEKHQRKRWKFKLQV